MHRIINVSEIDLVAKNVFNKLKSVLLFGCDVTEIARESDCFTISIDCRRIQVN